MDSASINPFSCSVILVSQTVTNLQRLYLPEGVDKELYGKYAKIKLSNGNNYFCRILSKPFLQPDICLLDESVKFDSTTNSSLKGEEKNLRIAELNVIPSVNYIKTITVSLVLKDIKEREKWVQKYNNFQDLLKGVLKLFVHINGSLVSLENLKETQKIGIAKILVHNIGNIPAGKVVDSTKVSVNEFLSSERYRQRSEICDIQIPGFDEPYDSLKEFICARQFLPQDFPKKYSIPQVLLVGPGGSGKKTLVRKVSHDCGAVLLLVDSTEICKPESGESESLLREKFQNAQLLAKEGLVVLLFLQVESISSKPGRILSQFNYLLDSSWDTPNLIIIGLTTSPDNLHGSIKTSSRFHHQIYVEIPTDKERVEMLKMLCKSEGVCDKFCDDIGKITPGYVISDLALLVRHTKRDLIKMKISEGTTSEMSEYCILKKNATVIEASSLRGELGIVKKNTLEITQLGGLNKVKETILHTIQWPLIHSAAFEKFNIKHPSGILLYGPPGCAKTSLARAMAAESNINFFAVSAADLYSPYVGDAERTVTNLFQRARAASPSLLFIDEIDVLVGCRGGRQKGSQERILSTFLMEMDGIGNRNESNKIGRWRTKVIVVAATNRPQVLDSALLRPGRLDKLIYVPPPDVNDRIEILKVVTKRMPLNDSVDLEYIARKTELFSGADIANLSREAAFKAMNEFGSNCMAISQEHWLDALKETPPSLTKDQIRWYNEYSFH